MRWNFWRIWYDSCMSAKFTGQEVNKSYPEWFTEVWMKVAVCFPLRYTSKPTIVMMRLRVFLWLSFISIGHPTSQPKPGCSGVPPPPVNFLANPVNFTTQWSKLNPSDSILRPDNPSCIPVSPFTDLLTQCCTRMTPDYPSRLLHPG